MKLQKVSPWVFSLLIHAIPVILLSLNLMGGKGNGDQAAGEKDGTTSQEPEHPELVNITVIDAPPPMPESEPEKTPEPEPQPLAQDDDDSMPSLDKEFLDLLKTRPPVVDENCYLSFNGIGVEYKNVGKLEVGRVYPGYPAERAGIKPGDLIKTVTGEDIIGPEGTSFQLQITRDGRTWIQTLKREKICFKRNEK